jgi:hypothetical protein
VIRIYRDTERVASPASVLFESNGTDTNVKVANEEFCVPKEMRSLAAVRVGFVLGEDLFNFGPIPMERLGVPWDVYFGGKKYAKSLGHLQHVSPAAACTIVFHGGEPGVGVVYSPCRSKLGSKANKTPSL